MTVLDGKESKLDLVGGNRCHWVMSLGTSCSLLSAHHLPWANSLFFQSITASMVFPPTTGLPKDQAIMNKASITGKLKSSFLSYINARHPVVAIWLLNDTHGTVYFTENGHGMFIDTNKAVDDPCFKVTGWKFRVRQHALRLRTRDYDFIISPGKS